MVVGIVRAASGSAGSSLSLLRQASRLSRHCYNDRHCRRAVRDMLSNSLDSRAVMFVAIESRQFVQECLSRAGAGICVRDP